MLNSVLTAVVAFVLLFSPGPDIKNELSSIPRVQQVTEKVLNSSLILLRAGEIDPLEGIPDESAYGLTGWRDSDSGEILCIVQFDRTPTRDMAQSLNPYITERLYYIPNHAYLVRVKAGALNSLQSVSGIRAAFRLPKWAKIDPMVWEQNKDTVEIEVITAPGRDALKVAHVLESEMDGVKILTSEYHHRQGRLDCMVDRNNLEQILDTLSGMEDVLSIMPYLEKQLLNDNSIWVGQNYDTANTTTYSLSATIWNHGISGQGQVVCVNDSGLDNDMCYFRYDSTDESKTSVQHLIPPDTGVLMDGTGGNPYNKVIAYYVQPGADEWDTGSASYHGTHVSGSVLGDNFAALSDPNPVTGHNSGDGMAPNARLVMQDVGDSSGSLSGLAGDLSDMFQQAYDAGARIHSDSWGTTESIYDATAMDMDEFMFRHEDFLFSVAMGNSGTGSADGSIGSPATAKSIVSVGATSNGSSSQANNLMDYSRGPVDDQRLKPDVCSPGSSINSASGSTSNTDNNCSPKTMSGTSMATPTTSGFLALIRQYYTDGFYPSGTATSADAMTPSGALMKATIVNGAMEMTGTDYATSSTITHIPSMDQGWGRTHLDNVLYFDGDSRQLRVWDVRHSEGLSTGEQVEYQIDVQSSSQPLKVHLVWSDPESTTLASVNLVNNLDLEVVSPGSTTYRGNVFNNGQSTTGGTADVLNPIEGFVLNSPATGTWTLRVKGTAVPGTGTAPYSDRQGYALVATFATCATAPSAPTGLTATNNGSTGIDLSWTSSDTSFLIYRAPGTSPSPEDFTLVGTASGTTYTDTTVQGGYWYTYRVRATDNCGESDPSNEASDKYTGNCNLFPTFAGLVSVNNDMSSPLCDLVLSWEAGSSNCPDASTLWYNVYRDTTPYFTPGPSNLIESTTEITCTDYLVDPMVTYYYIVRAEDSTTLNGGNHNGGNEDANTVMIMGTPWAAGRVPGTFSDDGGDTNAKLFLEGEWRVTNQENHTTGGTYSYHNAKDGNAYAAGQCAAATTPPLDLQPATSPVLSYWIRMNVEWEWDGVVTEISTDGGLSWSTLAPNETYPGDFSTGGGVSSPINACDYSLSQECFNGPSDNSGLTNWAQYTHNLAAYAGQTVQIRWNFSSDGGFEVEGFYLDDIQVTFASVNTDCATSDGAVALDRDTYNCDGDTISINVGDRDLRGNGTQNVTINSTTEPGGETVTLTESPANSGNFIGTITTTGSAPPSNGFLSLTHGDTITVMYVDADDGNGGIDVSKTDTATADCTPPMISNVQVINIGSSSATVTWDTNEVADSRVTYENDPSPSAYINYEGSYVTSHSLTLTGLYSCTKYFFFVESTDPSLNHALDDNSGSYYTFTTIVNTNPTYAASGLPLPIPDGNLTGVSSTISVPDDKTVVDVNVTLSITHPYDGDVDIYLIGPDLTQIALSLDHGSTGDNYTNTTFDDEAGTPIASGTPPFTGSFQPDQALSAFDLGSALGNWTLKVADDAGGDTGTLDAWSITFEYPPESCPTSDGTVELDDTLYGCSDALSVLLRDADLMGMGTVTVELFSDTETTPEDVSLSEDPAYSGIYTGTFTTSSTAPVHGDNLLSLSAGDTITVRYTDADDGLGGTDVVKTDTASAECQPPVISNVQVTSITDSSAVITWDTDESSDSRAVWSDTSPPSGSEASDTALVTSHSIPVTGLDPCTTYYFYVESTDIFSNTATDTNGASYYSFETYGTAQLFGPDDVEAGVGTWTPTSNTATIWHRDTCHAASGSYAWKAGASDAPTCTATYLASTTTDLESGTINLGSPGHSFHLLFNQWYETESGYDYCYVQISEDGGAYTDIVPRYAGSSGGWQAADYDLSAFSGPVKIRFRFTSDSGINREGWYIDDIEIRGPMPCGASLALDSYSFTDSCSGTGSGGDDIIDAGEDLEIVVTLFNNGIDPATGVQATLSSTTPGVTFPPSGNLAGFPDIDPLTGEVSLFPHFTVHVGNSVACDELLEFDLLITADDGGSWSDSFTLTTGLLTPPTPVSESFEPGVTPPALPSGWSVEQVNGGSGAWATRAGTRNPSGYASHSSPNLIYFNSYSVYSGNDVRLRTVNSFSTVGATDASLTFWMFHDDGYSTSNDRLQVQVSTDGTAFANVTGALFQRYDASEDSWQEHTVDLSAYLDEPYLWIGFVGISGYGNDIHLDDIVVTLAGTGGCSMTECQGVPDEVSASGSSFPLKIEKDSTMVACSTGYCLTFEKITTATGYNVYEGTLGNFYDHDSAGTNACDAAPSDLGDGTMRHDLSPTGSENRYYLVTAFNGNGEGTAGIAGRDAGLSCAP